MKSFWVLERSLEVAPYARVERRDYPAPPVGAKGSPFETYFVPGLILFCALGIGPLAAAQLAWRRHALAPIATLGVGVALLIWMAVEIAIIGYSNSPPLQPFYLLLGAVITCIGLGWRITARKSTN